MSAEFYQVNSKGLFEQYNKIESDTVHGHWKQLLSENPGAACDIGAGSGRDANWLAGMGWNVTAVEPCVELRSLAEASSHPNVCWVDDALPTLQKLRALNQRYNVILISAVWMHLPPADRGRAFRIISELLAPGALLVITLRHGPDDGRGFFEVTAEEVQAQARERALLNLLHQKSVDELGRDNVWWETLCFRLPDDGTGSLPLLRHIIVNDVKSSTYKLGLLRTLGRIAEGSPGMVIRRTDNFVTVPFGLVGLYWLKLYLPLIGKRHLRQHPNSARGYGFAKQDFYTVASKFSPYDLAVGNTFQGDAAAAIIGAIRDCCDVIQKMPTHHIRYPGRNSSVFECERSTTHRNRTSFQLDKERLSEFGEFRIPSLLWQSLGQFSCWIEPAIVNEWESLMLSWEPVINPSDLRQALTWNEGKRDTSVVRSRIDHLRDQGHALRCVWSSKDLRQPNYAVDHCFPWTRWQNNDLWNLMPTGVAVNANKSDRLPSAEQLHRSRGLIIEWWEEGFMRSELKDRFLVQAEASLPLVDTNRPSTAKIFDSVCFQRTILKTNQQLAEWTFK